MRLIPLVLLSLALAPAASADTPPTSTITTGPSVRDPVTDPIAGLYLSDADPNGSVVVSATGQGRVLAIAGPVWEAQGWYRDDAFVGAWRRPGLQAQPASEYRYGWLRFHREGDSTVVAQFTDDTGAIRLERWKLLKRFLAADVPPARTAATSSGDSLPRPGDTVEIEEFPRAVTTVPPVYPKRARQDGIEGTVIVQALIGRDGHVKDVRIGKSIPALDDAALAAVRQWIFRPARAKGQPVAVWVAVPVRFTLQ